MKNFKLLLFMVFSVFLLGLQAEAATGEGICYGKELTGGYCQITPVSINSRTMPNQSLFFTDGKSPSSQAYNGVLNGKNQDMFCIDANYSKPDRPYGLARTFNMSNGYDQMIAKAYNSYIEQVIAASSGVPTQATYDQYLQVSNVVMRTLTTKYGYTLSGGSTPSLIATANKFNNVYKQLGGISFSGVSLKTDSQAYTLTQKWYCNSILACTANQCSSKISATELNHCKNMPGVNGDAPKVFKVEVKADNDNVETIYSGDLFTKTVPFKITGLAPFLDQKYKSTNPSFKITGVKCSNKDLTCELEKQDIINKNIIPYQATDDFDFVVKIKGDQSKFTKEVSTKVILEYEYSHIMDGNNLSVLRYTLSSEHLRQRMIVLMPESTQNISTEISISVPSVCKAEIVDGTQKYTYGSTELSEMAYLETGCCNVDPSQLTDQNAVDYFLENCSNGDLVKLVDICVNDGSGDQSHSLVYQKNMPKIIEQIKNAEDMFDNGSYSQSDVQTVLKKFDNNRDDLYMKTGISPQNNFCKMYTSEKQDILYPGTLEATSGKFFYFNEFQQPSIEGAIMGDFHTDIKRWKKEYEAAVAKEKSSYTSWQQAAALENAIGKLESCYVDGECGCCNPTTDPKTGKPSCTGSCDTKYAGGNTKYADSGTFYTADGSDLSNISARQSCGCDTNSRTSNPSPSASSRRNTYVTAKTKRENLEKYKDECQKKSDIANKWKYFLSPDLTFYYKQKVVNPEGGSEKLTEAVPMEISHKSDGKYWKGVSDKNPIIIDNSVSGTYSPANYIVKYGAGSTAVNKTYTYDTTPDYTIGFEQMLYYKPTIYYYSIVPSGKYIISEEKTTDVSVLDVGYVFNVEITNYEGEYETWFELDKIGHLMQSPTITPKETSNIQNSVDKFLEENGDKYPDHEARTTGDIFASKCFYYNDQVLYRQDCLDCEDPNFNQQYFYRTVSVNNVTPNDRGNTNWTTEKGAAAKAQIEKTGDGIYDDYSKEHLEYSFTLSPTDMQSIKSTNKNTVYNDFDLKCKDDVGKECKSSFVEEWAAKSDTTDILNDTRNNKWKYYVNDAWGKGSIDSLLGGKYPLDTENYVNWP